jgi:hypothetical protein
LAKTERLKRHLVQSVHNECRAIAMTLQPFTNLPDEIKRIPNWIVWKYEDVRATKPTKVPYNPRTGRHADVTNSATWVTYETAVAYCQADEQGNASRYNGIGFVFQLTDKPDEDYIGIDLDAIDDPVLLARQIKVFDAFDSYSELSPSGNGLHIIVKGKIPSGRRRGSIEMYSDVRFFTMTGNSYPRNEPPKPIARRQELLDILWKQLGGAPKAASFVGTYDEPDTDEVILDRALKAVNGDKFAKLCGPEWVDLYQSQSEADFAFMDIIGFYTESKNQVTRIFRASHLGQREKAQRSDYVGGMVNRVFDRKLPLVDIEANNNMIEEYLAKARQAEKDKAALWLPAPTLDVEALEPDAMERAPEQMPEPASGSPYTIPPGLLGEVAHYIYSASPRPVPEVALAAAISYLAGICGRAFNVSNTGLNQYVLLLAPTGTGKEAMSSGLSRLNGAVAKYVPAISQFMGPGEIASGQALLKYLSKTSSCFLSIIGEFGIKMQQLSSQRANPAELMLKRVLLDLYNKSGASNVLQPSIYSQKENNTDVLYAPCVTLLGESTPETFFAGVDETMIADGLLPRFTFIEYRGIRVPYNKAHSAIFPHESLVQSVSTLAAIVLKFMNSKAVEHVKIELEADQLLDKINEHADAMINGTNSDVTRHLWNRAHIKVMKLAALVAVGVNYSHPVITVENVRWAQAIIEYDIAKLQARFESGEVGCDSEETKQTAHIARIVRDYVTQDVMAATRYGSTFEFYRDKIVPFVYINKRLSSVAAFRKDRAGATTALHRAIRTTIDCGLIAEIGRAALQKKYGTSQAAYSITDLSILR